MRTSSQAPGLPISQFEGNGEGKKTIPQFHPHAAWTSLEQDGRNHHSNIHAPFSKPSSRPAPAGAHHYETGTREANRRSRKPTHLRPTCAFTERKAPFGSIDGRRDAHV